LSKRNSKNTGVNVNRYLEVCFSVKGETKKKSFEWLGIGKKKGESEDKNRRELRPRKLKEANETTVGSTTDMKDSLKKLLLENAKKGGERLKLGGFGQARPGPVKEYEYYLGGAKTKKNKHNQNGSAVRQCQ